ncbi:MAG: alpha/beta hydrolase, partial [Ignavibacteria bacterium]|nr:alpha/beta hydrolase [Ignavibacteria bacterium]
MLKRNSIDNGGTSLASLTIIAYNQRSQSPSILPSAMSFILSNDSTVYYEEYGTGEPLILLPGLLGTIESHWRRFIPSFAQRFHTVAVDLRGHGRTNNPSGILSLRALVEDLHVLLDTLQLPHVRICGYGIGGYIGLLYGLQHPGSVQYLVMHATKFYWTPQAVLEALALLPDQDGNGGLQKDHAPGNGPDGWKRLLSASQGLIEEMATHGVAEDALALAGFPVLITVGELDGLIPYGEAERLARSLPAG